MERNGSRLMMYTDDPAVITSPRPAPISSSSDLLMPALAVFGACVLSIICACDTAPISSPAALIKLRTLRSNRIAILLGSSCCCRRACWGRRHRSVSLLHVSRDDLAVRLRRGFSFSGRVTGKTAFVPAIGVKEVAGLRFGVGSWVTATVAGVVEAAPGVGGIVGVRLGAHSQLQVAGFA